MSLSRTVARAAVACGVLDLAYVCAVFGPRGLDPVRMLQGIAAAPLGPGAVEAGRAIAFLGLALHFAVAASAATGYVALTYRYPSLRRPWLASGAVYGVAFYAVMYVLVLPLTHAAPARFPPPGWRLVLLAHVLCVGWPIARVVATAPAR